MGTFDDAEFRRVLGHFPTGVTIITSIDGDSPVGFTIGSFTSVSLDPPLVGFLPMRDSYTWAKMRAAGMFCVNVLGHQHGELCWTFARPATDASSEGERFAGVEWTPAPSGAPRLTAAIAWIDCTIEAVYEMGDHDFVLGRVGAVDTNADYAGDDDPVPLLFFRGTLGRFAVEG